MMNLNAPETIRFYRPDDLTGVEVLAVENSPKLWRWFHQTYSICTVFGFDNRRQGQTKWAYRGREWSIGARSTMMMEPGEIHDTRHMTGACSFRTTLFDPAEMTKAAREMGLSGSRPHLRLAGTDSPDLFRAFQKLHECLELPSTKLERQTRLAACQRILLEQTAEKKPEPLVDESKPKAVHKAVALIREKWSKAVSLEEVAAVTGLSRFRLAHAFTRAVGIAPHAYQIQLRIGRARELLIKGAPVSEVAFQTGFADQSHLNRHFKRFMGVTPLQ